MSTTVSSKGRPALWLGSMIAAGLARPLLADHLPVLPERGTPEFPFHLFAALFLVLGFEYVLRFVFANRLRLYLLFGLLSAVMGAQALVHGLSAGGMMATAFALRSEAVAGHLEVVLAIQILWTAAQRPIGWLLRLYQASHLLLAAFVVAAAPAVLAETAVVRAVWTLPLLVGALVLAFRRLPRFSSSLAARLLGFGVVLVLAVHVVWICGLLGLLPAVGSLVRFGSFAVVLVGQRAYDEWQRETSRAELQRLRTSLEAEVERRTRELETERARTEEESNSRRDFIYALSHEIRTPVHSVLGLADWLMEMRTPPLARNLIELIRTSGYNLLHQLNGVLDLARLEQGGQRRREKPFAPSEVVEEALDLSSAGAWERDLRLTSRLDPELPAVVLGDRDRFLEVLVNLVGNAVKFTPSGGVEVELTSRPLADGTLQLHCTVTDTGPGIPEAKLEQLFEPFWRGHGGTRGSGLGLAICRQLVDLLAGRLWVRTREGEGSAFHFTFAVRPLSARWVPVVARMDSLRGRAVAVIEPQAEQLDYLVERLQDWGVEPRPFTDPAQAEAWLAAQGGSQVVAWSPRLAETPGTAEALEALRNGDHPLRWVELPLAGSEQEAAWRLFVEQLVDLVELDTVPAAAAADTPLRVLVADDEDINLEVTLHLLTKLGHHAEGVLDGAGVLRRVRQAEFDAILLDIGLPDISGVEVARRLRRMLPADSMPRIAALTARAELSLREHCLQMGMDGYLVKPVIEEDLAALLARRPLPPTVRRVEADAAPDEAAGDGEEAIDWAQLRALVDLGEAEDPDLVPSLVHRFEERFADDLWNLHRAAEDDRGLFAHLAHRLAGRSANLGLLRVSARCRRVEGVCRTASTAALQREIQRLALEVDEASHELRSGAPAWMPLAPAADELEEPR